MVVLWKAATVATRVEIYHIPLYSSVNSSLVCVIISAERVFSLRRMYGCTEVPYSTSDHSFSLPEEIVEDPQQALLVNLFVCLIL